MWPLNVREPQAHTPTRRSDADKLTDGSRWPMGFKMGQHCTEVLVGRDLQCVFQKKTFPNICFTYMAL